MRLTGERCASLNNVGLRWHYDNRDGGWATGIIDKLGICLNFLDKWPSRVVAPGDVVGNLSAAAAAELGLTTRTKLVQGGADALIGMIGLGVANPVSWRLSPGHHICSLESLTVHCARRLGLICGHCIS